MGSSQPEQHRDPAGLASESARGRPAPALRPFVAWYSGYRQAGRPSVHRGLPSPYLTMIFTLDDPLVLASHPDPRQPPGTYDTLVGGLHTSPALITHDGRQSGIQLMLSPLGARALLNLPAGELTAIDVDGAQVLGGLAARIREQLCAAPDWPGRFAALDRLLGARLGDTPPMSAETAWAWRELLASGGAVSIAELARQTGWSSRHLRGRFRAEIGLTPKAAARVIRFDRARRLLQRQAARGPLPPLADIAAECGYYDQAHLAREFRDLAGCPPSAWLAQECRNVQAGAGELVTGSQA
jgi:AraC-like DNA-binding protein